MAMGLVNASPTFAGMMPVIRKLWQDAADEARVQGGSEVIIDDVMLFALTVHGLFAYMRIVLATLKHFRCTVKLKKCRFLAPRQEFVGIDIMDAGNTPAQAKFSGFRAFRRPSTGSDLRLLIGALGFYANWLPWFELRIVPWRNILLVTPTPNQAARKLGAPPRNAFLPRLGASWRIAHESPTVYGPRSVNPFSTLWCPKYCQSPSLPVRTPPAVFI